MPTQTSDIASILQRELSRRCQANPRYSLRAFARALGVSPANLCLVLNRRRMASRKTVERVLSKIELPSRDRRLIAEKFAVETQAPEENVSLETVERISSWLAYALLSLTKTKDFSSDPRWMARRLGVTIHEVRASLEALKAVGLMEKTGSTWRRKNNGGIRLNNAVSTSVTRAFHRELLAKAVHSMENDPVETRDISSVTFAVSPERMKEVKEEIRKFRLRMSELFEEPSQSTEVYNLTGQMTPVTRRK